MSRFKSLFLYLINKSKTVKLNFKKLFNRHGIKDLVKLIKDL